MLDLPAAQFSEVAPHIRKVSHKNLAEKVRVQVPSLAPPMVRQNWRAMRELLFHWKKAKANEGKWDGNDFDELELEDYPEEVGEEGPPVPSNAAANSKKTVGVMTTINNSKGGASASAMDCSGGSDYGAMVALH